MNSPSANEELLDRYIESRRLPKGARLPSPGALAVELALSEAEVLAALEAAANHSKVIRDQYGWVVLPDVPGGHHPFSFSRSVELHDRKLETTVLESAVRKPIEDKYHPLCEVESAAAKALGVTEGSNILAIGRIRVVDGEPCVFHRAYLDPARFPQGFEKDHDFSRESLIDLYAQCGYKLLTRHTVLSARGPSPFEEGILVQRFHTSLRWEAVLDAEQELWAEDPRDHKPFVLEFLKAAYRSGWKYAVKGRVT